MELLAPAVPPRGAVLVIHSWWGLTGSFRDYAGCLTGSGFLVGLADLFDGRTASTEAEARRLRAAPRRVPMYRTLQDDIGRLRDAVAGGDNSVGVVGFSMGGHWAVWLSQRPEHRLGATVLYYAARAGDWSRCRTPVLAHFADRDPWVGESARRRMEKAIRLAECAYRAIDHPGTEHWFAESDRPEFHAGAAQRAAEADLDHLRRNVSTA